MPSPLQWYVCKRDLIRILDHTALVSILAFRKVEVRSFALIFQVTRLMKCFTSYEEDNAVKLLIVKVMDITACLLSFNICLSS